MKIAICGNLIHYKEMDKIRSELINLGHEVEFPASADRLINKEVTMENVAENKKDFTQDKRKERYDIIVTHMRKIKSSGAVLVVNMEKKGIQNYIGGNTFLEMGFALAYDKAIYLYNPVPDVAYKDEITGMLPIIINGNLEKIK